MAPSTELRVRQAAREAELLGRGGAVMAPLADSAVPADPRIAAEGLRTIPPRETGGNLDVKQLTAGTTLLIPVATEGALFSVWRPTSRRCGGVRSSTTPSGSRSWTTTRTSPG
ncbi:acetamidase/formamidase family protein [Pseudonocardia sp. D17]|uniref:acetamidase/formamidase family protein n=1 Tax=Pseudonocardia sp. D17 TaxID=882661 RepID=UPI002B37071C|nr:hypothetical protein PSD17_63720 [Pseudonocardia sp. D17]